LFFEKNANFFRRKLSKIAENCDHNIGPWKFVPLEILDWVVTKTAKFSKSVQGFFLLWFLATDPHVSVE
jgi:hypothetical protein